MTRHVYEYTSSAVVMCVCVRVRLFDLSIQLNPRASNKSRPHEKLLGISGCRNRPLQPSECRPRLTQMGENRKVLWFGVGTNQIKDGTRGRKIASKKLELQMLGTANAIIVLSDASMCNATFT